MTIGEAISWIGSIASLVSLVLTFWIFWQIRKLKKFYVFVNRAPQLLTIIQKQEKGLSKFMGDFSNSLTSIKLELGSLRGNLSSLQIVVDKPMKYSIQRVILLVEQYNVISHQTGSALKIFRLNCERYSVKLRMRSSMKDW